MPNAKKQITINPDLFKVGGKSTLSNNKSTNKNKTQKKLKPLIKPTAIKKELLKRIKQHQTEQQDKKLDLEKTQDNDSEKSNDNIDISKFTDDFNDKLSYLETISQDKIKKKQYTLKNNKNPNNDPTINVNTSLPVELHQPPPITLSHNPISHISPIVHGQPAYSNLKGSSKPSFRQWKKNNTLRKTDNSFDIKPAITVLDEHKFEGLENERKKLLHKLKFKLKQNKINSLEHSNNKKLRQTLKKNNYYETFGGNKNKGFVGVFVKNKHTRKTVEQEKKLLRKHDIPKIKKYLQEHGLLKVGSLAPEDVLREIYEKTFLTGEIKNTNKDILMHNYLND